MKQPLALILSGLAGYVSLSQEILWFRVISYSTGSSPTAFADLLGFFLLGLALGSWAARRLADRTEDLPLLLSGLFLAAGLIGFFGVPTVANAYLLLDTAAIGYAYLLIACVALPSGVLFPLVCHLANRGAQSAGASLSAVYMANIVGACLGPLVTTFVLMDRLPLPQICLAVAAVAMAAAALPLVALPLPTRRRAAGGAAVAAALAAVFAFGGPAYAQLFEKLHFKSDLDPARPYTELIQTRSGVVARGGSIGADNVWGGGIYDGAYNVDPSRAANAIHHAYAIAVLHRNPEEVLEIGLSSGAWARVIANHAAVRSLEAVEIDPGYLALMKNAPAEVQVVQDPKVKVFIDDGRRWLRRNPDRRFDLIVMNTSYHWRSHASNVLSAEFLALCKAHLKPNGVVYLNSTNSQDVWFTLAKTFRHVVAVDQFIAGSDAPFDQSPDERRQNLLRFTWQGAPVYLASALRTAAMEKLVRWDLTDHGDALRARKDLIRVTDDNMATEFRGPESRLRYDPTLSWGRVFAH